jgi:hypothetical protein
MIIDPPLAPPVRSVASRTATTAGVSRGPLTTSKKKQKESAEKRQTTKLNTNNYTNHQ